MCPLSAKSPLDRRPVTGEALRCGGNPGPFKLKVFFILNERWTPLSGTQVSGGMANAELTGGGGTWAGQAVQQQVGEGGQDLRIRVAGLTGLTGLREVSRVGGV
jgi:hypothetical protein